MKCRNGFTLVEMLVATALVVLMMLLFAQVFQTAAGLISNQKGMAEQDQRVRTLTILLEGDMDQRTFRDVAPFYPGQDTENAEGYEPIRRRGFFSISENDPNNGTDDVLHLTVKVYEGGPKKFRNEGPPQLPFAGRAVLLRRPNDPPDDQIDERSEAEMYLLGDENIPPNDNQPEFDDGQLSLNETGFSRHAEVCWFLRNGVLYRREMLIRDGYANTTVTDPQPTNANGDRFVPGDYTAANVPPEAPWHTASGEFWRDFDYSAYYEPDGGLRFHNADSLINSSGDEPASNPNLLNLPASLGLPFLRFGSSTNRAQIIDGELFIQGPREFLTPDDPATYIGRFNHQETSHSEFGYPGRVDTGDPFDDGTVLTLTDNLVDEFSDELFRRGEDIVMTNVHSFDIKIWDDSRRQFVDLGDGSNGVYGQSANADFGNRYDTWHPNAGMPPTPYPNVETPPELGSADEVPLKAVQILIRFYDVGSDSMRDLTFTFPLK